MEVKEYQEAVNEAVETAMRKAKDRMDIRMANEKSKADKIRRKTDLVEGELVLYRDYRLRVGMSEKYKNTWGKVYRIRRIEGQQAYIVPKDEPNIEPKRVHLDQIKRFYCEEERKVDKEKTKPR